MPVAQPETIILQDNPPAPKWKFANPAPIGLCAFATTTFALSVINAHWWDKSTAKVVAGMALYHGGIVQVIAGIFEWIMGNHFASLAFLSYGAFWMSYYHFDFEAKARIPPGQIPTAAGVFLLPWTLLTVILTIASIRTTKALFTVFCFLLLTFIILTIGEFEESVDTIKAAGWFGVITALGAFYCAFAGLINSMWEKEIVPVGHLKKD